jgi:hypothetical protein
MLEPNRAPLPRHRLMPPNLSLCRRFPSRSRVAHSMSRNRGISRRSRRMSCFPDGSLTTTRQRMLSQGPPIGRSDRGLTSDRVVMQRQILCRLHRPRCQRRSHKRHASPVCTLCLKSGYDEDCGKSLIPPLPTWVIKYKQHLSRSPQLQAPPASSIGLLQNFCPQHTSSISPRSHKSLAKSFKARRQNEARTVCEQGPVCRSQRCAHSRSSPSQSSMTSTCRRPAVTGVTQWNLCETKTSALRR